MLVINLFLQIKVFSSVKIILLSFKRLRECSLCNVNFHKVRLRIYSFHFGIDKARQLMALWTLLKTNIELRNKRVEKKKFLHLKTLLR